MAYSMGLGLCATHNIWGRPDAKSSGSWINRRPWCATPERQEIASQIGDLFDFHRVGGLKPGHGPYSKAVCVPLYSFLKQGGFLPTLGECVLT